MVIERRCPSSGAGQLMATSIEESLHERGAHAPAGFFRVRQLVPDDQDVLTVPIGTPLAKRWT